MSSGGKGKTTNVASFMKEHLNIVGNSILVMILLGLEKLMDLEFKCPGDKPLAIVYSLVFLLVPTTIVGIVACYLSANGMCCKTKKRGNDTETKAGAEEDNSLTDQESHKSLQNFEMSEPTTETKMAKCRCKCCCENIQSHFFAIKVVVFWILIVITDGRYGDCLVRSVDDLMEINKNSSYRVPRLSFRELRSNYVIELFQIIGLILILLLIIVIVFFESKLSSLLSKFGCKCESESEKYKKKNEDILLQITEDIIQEQAREKQKKFVETLLTGEDWASYNPGQPDALEELEKITTKWKNEVKRQLEGAGLSQAKAETEQERALGGILQGAPQRGKALMPLHYPTVLSTVQD